MAFRQQHLRLVWIIIIGSVSATAGDNVGYLLGHTLGRRLLHKWKHLVHVDNEDIQAGEELIRRHGAATIFWARFIFGLRTIAGPLAGILRMHWRKFLLWNALGAASWVCVIVALGYGFGHAFNSLLDFFEKADLAIMAAIIGLGFYLWRRYTKRKRHRRTQKPAPKAA
jgi:membrane-associated protein